MIIMEKNVAEDFMKDILALSDVLNGIMQKVEKTLSDDELLMMRQHLGMMMMAVDQHLFGPIVKQYPDLDPHL